MYEIPNQARHDIHNALKLRQTSNKIILISDLHLNRWNYGATTTADGLNSRLLSQTQFLYWIRDVALQYGAKAVWCLGDLFHTNQTIHAEVLRAAYQGVTSIYSAGVTFNSLVGNHDMATKDGSLHSLHWLSEYGEIVTKPGIVDLGGVRTLAVPYTEDAEVLKQAFDRPRHDGAQIALLHQGIDLNNGRGSAWVLNEIFTKDMIPEHIKKVFTGHYHKPVDDDKVSIVGSAMQHTWSDADGVPRGCIVLDPETLEFTRIPNPISPRFVECSLEQLPTDLTKVRNLFLRVHNVPKDSIDEVREPLIKNGAISVEIDIALDKAPKEEGIKPAVVTMEGALNEFEQAVDEKVRVIGRQLREQIYEAPKVQS